MTSSNPHGTPTQHLIAVLLGAFAAPVVVALIVAYIVFVVARALLEAGS